MGQRGSTVIDAGSVGQAKIRSRRTRPWLFVLRRRVIVARRFGRGFGRGRDLERPCREDRVGGDIRGESRARAGDFKGPFVPPVVQHRNICAVQRHGEWRGAAVTAMAPSGQVNRPTQSWTGRHNDEERKRLLVSLIPSENQPQSYPGLGLPRLLIVVPGATWAVACGGNRVTRRKRPDQAGETGSGRKRGSESAASRNLGASPQ